jgi:hypothetical protein
MMTSKSTSSSAVNRLLQAGMVFLVILAVMAVIRVIAPKGWTITGVEQEKNEAVVYLAPAIADSSGIPPLPPRKPGDCFRGSGKLSYSGLKDRISGGTTLFSITTYRGDILLRIIPELDSVLLGGSYGSTTYLLRLTTAEFDRYLASESGSYAFTRLSSMLNGGKLAGNVSRVESKLMLQETLKWDGSGECTGN